MRLTATQKMPAKLQIYLAVYAFGNQSIQQMFSDTLDAYCI
jgi:hypothetical protein